MHLDCKSPDVLEIHRAEYGAAADICQNGPELNQSCTVVDRTQTVKSRCDNQPLCSIVAWSCIFGDPCPGLHKYLNVIYACGKSNVIYRIKICVCHNRKENVINNSQNVCVLQSFRKQSVSVVVTESVWLHFSTAVRRLGFRR